MAQGHGEGTELFQGCKTTLTGLRGNCSSLTSLSGQSEIVSDSSNDRTIRLHICHGLLPGSLLASSQKDDRSFVYTFMRAAAAELLSREQPGFY
jgi:hypothetical protein